MHQKRFRSDNDDGRHIRGVPFNQIQKASEKLTLLLEHREPAQGAWNEQFRDELQNMYLLASRALGKSQPLSS